MQITVAETIGTRGRADYYDGSGALRDMVQNHLLQLLCLVAMEPPATLDREAIRDEKLKVLQSLRPHRRRRGRLRQTVRGQYAQAGAATATPCPATSPSRGRPSHTETFVALQAEVANWRWAGRAVLPALRQAAAAPRASEIVVQFQHVPHSIFPGSSRSRRTGWCCGCSPTRACACTW